MPTTSYTTGISKTSEKLWFYLILQLFFFSNYNINPHQTHLAKHQILSPNHQFSKLMWYDEYCPVHAHMAWSQKFRMTPESIF